VAALRQSLQRQAPDVAGFADYVTQLFGSPVRGLATVIRATPEYRAWRATVEWCAVCKQYAPIRQGRALGTVFDHHLARSGLLCPNSHNVTRWIGHRDKNDQARRDTLLRLLGVAPQTEPSLTEEVQTCND
jgi:hypothetical protein